MNVAFSVGKSLVDENGKYVEELSKFEPVPHLNPSVYDLVDTVNYDALVDKIQASSLSDKEKAFLVLTSARLMKFDYTKIARYYIHASDEMKALMRESALVVLDKDTANALGFVKGVIREK